MPPPDLDLHPEARAARGSMSPNDPSRVSWGIGSTLAAILYVNGASLRRFERRHDFKRMELDRDAPSPKARLDLGQIRERRSDSFAEENIPVHRVSLSLEISPGAIIDLSRRAE